MTPEERFERIERNLDRVAEQQAAQAANHAEAMSELYSIVTQIGQQTLVLGQRLTELINAMRRGERNGQS